MTSKRWKNEKGKRSFAHKTLPSAVCGMAFHYNAQHYLIYFYQPSKESGIPNLIPQGRIVLGVLTVIGLIKAVGHIIDAVTDPLIAADSDKSKNKNGRRIPLMQKAAVPFGLCTFLMFFVPLNYVSGFNAVWIAYSRCSYHSRLPCSMCCRVL